MSQHLDCRGQQQQPQRTPQQRQLPGVGPGSIQGSGPGPERELPRSTESEMEGLLRFTVTEDRCSALRRNVRGGPDWATVLFRTTRDEDSGQYLEYQRPVEEIARRDRRRRFQPPRRLRTTFYHTVLPELEDGGAQKKVTSLTHAPRISATN